MPNDRDQEVLPLPKRWFFRYYIFQPIRLLVKQAFILQSKLSPLTNTVAKSTSR